MWSCRKYDDEWCSGGRFLDREGSCNNAAPGNTSFRWLGLFEEKKQYSNAADSAGRIDLDMSLVRRPSHCLHALVEIALS